MTRFARHMPKGEGHVTRFARHMPKGEGHVTRFARHMPLAVAALLLTSCHETAEGADHGFRVEHVDVDGRSIPCVVWDERDDWSDVTKFGLSCDWALQ